MPTIYEELLTCAQASGDFKPPQVGEDDLKYLKRLVYTIATVPDDTFYKMSKGTQKWYNKAADAVNNTEIKFDWNCPGFKEPPVVPPPPPRVSSSQPNPVATNERRKRSGVIEAIRKQVVKHPDWTSRQIHQFLIDNGFPEAKLETVIVNSSDAHNMISIVKELGHWKDVEPKTPKAQSQQSLPKESSAKASA